MISSIFVIKVLRNRYKKQNLVVGCDDIYESFAASSNKILDNHAPLEKKYMRGYHSLTHTLTHYPLTSRYMPSMCDYQFSIVSSIRVDFDKFQLGGSTVLNHL